MGRIVKVLSLVLVSLVLVLGPVLRRTLKRRKESSTDRRRDSHV